MLLVSLEWFLFNILPMKVLKHTAGWKSFPVNTCISTTQALSVTLAILFLTYPSISLSYVLMHFKMNCKHLYYTLPFKYFSMLIVTRVQCLFTVYSFDGKIYIFTINIQSYEAVKTWNSDFLWALAGLSTPGLHSFTPAESWVVVA